MEGRRDRGTNGTAGRTRRLRKGEKEGTTNEERKTAQQQQQQPRRRRLFLLTARKRGELSLTRALTNSIHRLGLSQDLWLNTDGVCYHHQRFNCFCGRPSSDRRTVQAEVCVLYVRTVNTEPSVFRRECNKLQPVSLG